MDDQTTPNQDTEQPTDDQDTILVVSAPAGSRGVLSRKLRVEELAVNVNLFIDQIGSVLEKTPDKVGKFQFVELELHAEITAKGALAVLGTGGEAGATGGIKFVFRKTVE
jgi:hypothetical protein